MTPAGLTELARAWLADDPDPRDQAELAALLAASEGQGAQARAALAELAGRFAGRLVFGTAGLRGAIGAGPNRMNRAVVRAATAALAGWLPGHSPGAAASGVVIGCDARHRSADFADEAAAVLAGAGIRVHLLPRPCPTPLLAFAVRRLSAAAGIMITASHNPPGDNGYKLYLGDGAQIVPPADAQIEAAIRALGPLADVPVTRAGPLVTWLGDEVARAYLDAIVAATVAVPAARPAVPAAGPALPSAEPALRVVYTPLHGVAAALAGRAFEQAGFPAPHVVGSQAEPDPGFPTVSFPNPEEPGVLDAALADARRLDADLVLANDPDGDRLAVAVPDPAATGGWRVLTGDQVGCLLGACLLEQTAGDPDPAHRLVVTTVVSSTLLAKVAAAAGARFAQTLTGFKWIVRAADPGAGGAGARFVFGYEEALGYAVGTTVRDKDGISAALAVLGLATAARAAGESLLTRWDALETAHGVHLTAQLTLATAAPGAVLARLRAGPPARLAGDPVLAVTDLAAGNGALPPSDVLSYRLGGTGGGPAGDRPAGCAERTGRVVLRPSGTEPKLKAYLEVTEPVTAGELAGPRTAATARMAALRAAVEALMAAG